MGVQQSKNKLLYEKVSCGDVEGIKALRREGAGLECIDREGRSPLILACTHLKLYHAAKTLMQLGANVNACRRGRKGGTPLHHAAKRGLDKTVKLLLSHGANALVMNHRYQTPLDIARVKGHHNVVRAIEGHLCLFSGWLRELHGPGVLELVAPQLLSRRVWVVVLPCCSHNKREPLRMEIAVYSSVQDAQPRTIVPLRKANLEKLNLNQPDPFATISNISRIPRRWRRRRGIKSSQQTKRTRMKLAPLHEVEKLQLQQFVDACRGIPQEMHPSFPVPAPPPGAQSTQEDAELAAAINASLKLDSQASTSKAYVSKCDVGENIGPSSIPAQPYSVPFSQPSADKNPIGGEIENNEDAKDASSSLSSLCTICLDAPLEGACIPCGHMVGCMRCLNEIKEKKFGCPVCRSQIDQLLRVYSAA